MSREATDEEVREFGRERGRAMAVPIMTGLLRLAETCDGLISEDALSKMSAIAASGVSELEPELARHGFDERAISLYRAGAFRALADEMRRVRIAASAPKSSRN